MNFVKIKLYFCSFFPPISRLLRPVSCHLIDTPDLGTIKINFQKYVLETEYQIKILTAEYSGTEFSNPSHKSKLKNLVQEFYFFKDSIRMNILG